MDATLSRRALLKYSLAGAVTIGMGSAVPLGRIAAFNDRSASGWRPFGPSCFAIATSLGFSSGA